VKLDFYKLHLGGNSFLLIDIGKHSISTNALSPIARQICDRRYGVGASACIFLSPDNFVRIFLPNGKEHFHSYDAFFCAARYSFDSGYFLKTANKDRITLKTPLGDRGFYIISPREFKISLGSPFSLTNGARIDKNSKHSIETIRINNKPVCISGFHIKDDIVAVNAKEVNISSFFDLYLKINNVFTQNKTYLVYYREVAKEAMSIRTIKRGPSTSCISAAASLVSSVLSGNPETASVFIFEKGSPSLYTQEINLLEDFDDSRKLTILWENETNELFAIGSAGYTFEGSFDYRDGNIKNYE